MEKLSLYKVKKDEIIKSDKITPEDIILVLNHDDNHIFLYRGKYSLHFDEFNSKKLYERIINRFLNPNIFLIKNLKEKEGDGEQILKIKQFIVDRYPNLLKFELKRSLKDVFLFAGIRRKIKEFKNYENSAEWRSKLSNLTNLWKLSSFNLVALLTSIIIIFGKLILEVGKDDFPFLDNNGNITYSLWYLWQENLIFILSVLGSLLIIVFLVNLVFFLFPMKMPIKPVRYEKILFEKVAKYPHSEKIESLKGPKTPTKMTKKKKEPKKQITKPKLPPKLNIDLKPKKSFKPPKMEKTEDLSEEDLGIASVPMKKPIKIDIDQRKLDELAKKETEKTKFILIECPICGQPPIVMPVPKKIIKNSEEPVVDISYVHGDPQHVIVAQLDHDYQVRRRRASWVVFEEKN